MNKVVMCSVQRACVSQSKVAIKKTKRDRNGRKARTGYYYCCGKWGEGARELPGTSINY